MSAKLPSRNPRAGLLCLTDEEWAAVSTLVSSELLFRRAWIYGSRLRGFRRDERKSAGPDIDIAVEYPSQDFTEVFNWAKAVELRWSDLIKGHNIHLETYLPTNAFAAEQMAGRLLVDRR